MASAISFKPEVRLVRACLDACMLDVYLALLDTAPQTVDDLVVVTSLDDSTHGAASLHYVGRAVDVRIYGARPGAIISPGGADPAVEANKWAGRLRQRLGHAFQVILEADHIHVEWDPK